MEQNQLPPIVRRPDVRTTLPKGFIPGEAYPAQVQDQPIFDELALQPADQFPSFDEFLNNNEEMLGNVPIPLAMKQRALQGSVQDRSEIALVYDKAYSIANEKRQIPVGAKTQLGVGAGEATTTLVSGFDQEFLNTLSEEQRKRLDTLMDNRIGLTPVVQKAFTDPYVQAAILDRVSSSDFWDDTGRRMKQEFADIPGFGQAVVGFLKSIPNYSMAGIQYVTEDYGFFGDEEEQQKRRDQRDAAIDENFRLFDTTVRRFGRMGDVARAFDKQIREYMIETYGEEFVNSRYPDVMGPDGPIETPIVNVEQANALMDYSFKQMPKMEKFGSFAIRNLGMTSAFSAPYYAAGGIKAKRLSKFLERNPQYRQLDPVRAYRVMRTQAERNSFSKGYGAALNRMAEKFPFTGESGYRGSLGTIVDTGVMRRRLTSLRQRINETKNRLKDTNLDDATRNQLKADLSSFEGEWSKTWIRGGFVGQPAITSTAVSEAVIAAGQTFGYEYANTVGISDDAGGMVGALSVALFGKPSIKFASSAGVGLSNVFTGGQFGAVMEATARQGEEIISMLSGGKIPVGMITNRRFDAIREEYQRQGIPFTVQSEREYNAMADFLAGIPEANRSDVFNSVVEINAVRNSLVRAYGEDQRAEAAEMLRLPFAAVSELAILQGIEKSSLSSIKSMGDIGAVINSQNRAERLLLAQQGNITRLKEMLREQGQDTEDYTRTFDWIQNAERSTNQQLMSLAARREDTHAILMNYKNSILKDPSGALPEGMLDDLIEIETNLQLGGKDIVLGIEERRNIVNQSFAELSAALNARMDELEADGIANANTRLNYGRHLEAAYDLKLRHRIHLMKAGYAKVDEMMAGQEIDLSQAVTDIVGDLSKMQAKDMRGLFSPDKKFFTGTSGRALLNTLEDMAKRSLSENFSQKSIDEFMTAARTPFKKDGTENKFYISDNPTYLQVAAALVDPKKAGKKFNPFKALASEVEEVRGHLAREQFRLQDTNAPLSSQYGNIKDSLDDALDGIPGLGKELTKARKNAKDVRFDPYRKGGMAQRLDNGRLGKAEAKDPETGYDYLWKEGLEPDSWHQPMADSISGAIESTGDELQRNITKLKNAKSQFVRTWGDSFESENGRRIIGFDLSTDEGMENFHLAKQSVEILFRDAWSGKRLRQLRAARAKGQTAYAGPFEPQETPLRRGSYDFSTLDNIDQLEEQLIVSVKGRDGTVREVSLFDFHRMTEVETDIVSLIEMDDALMKDMNDYRQLVNDGINKLDNLDSELARQQAQSINQLKKVSGMNIDQMYEMVSQQGMAGIEKLRMQFTARDAKMSPEAFDNAMRYFVPQMLLKRAAPEVEPQRLSRKRGIGGDQFVVETFIQPELLIKDLTENKAVMDVVDAYMEPETVDFMINAATFSQVVRGVDGPTASLGGLRPISHNEIVSRAFNLSRGMVSPQYVAAEFALRLLSQRNSNILQLVAESQDAGAILNKLLVNPRDFEEKDVKALLPLLTSFVIREYARAGETIPEHVSQQLDIEE